MIIHCYHILPNLLFDMIYLTIWSNKMCAANSPFKALRYKSECPGIDSRCRRIFPMASDRSMCPGADSGSKCKYQDILLGKGGRCVRLTTCHLHVPMVKKSDEEI